MARLASSFAVAALSLVWVTHATIEASATGSPPQPMGVIDGDGRVYVRDLPKNSWLRELASPVGRVFFVTAEGASIGCSGFILSHEYVMTNYHCAHEDDGTRRIAKSIVMGFLGGGEGGTITDLKPTVVEASGDLDYAIVAFTQWTTIVPVYGRVALSDTLPEIGDNLIMIGHPQGRPLQVSQKGCSAVQEDRYRGALAHTCDSEPGSSGSPVFSADTGQVVAVNFGGYEDGSAPNVATLIASIAAVSPIVRGLLPDDADDTVRNAPAAVEPRTVPDRTSLLVPGAMIFASLCLVALIQQFLVRDSSKQVRSERRSRPSVKRPRGRRQPQSPATILSRFFDAKGSRGTRRRPRSVQTNR